MSPSWIMGGLVSALTSRVHESFLHELQSSKKLMHFSA